MGIAARCHPAAHLAIKRDRLVADDVGVLCVDDEGAQAQRSTGSFFGDRRLFADEIGRLVQRHKAREPGFQRAVERAVLARPASERLVEAQCIQGAKSEQADAEFLACLHQRVEDIALIFRLHPDFIAEIAGIGDASDDGLRHAEIHTTDIHELECGVREVEMGEFLHHLPRLRAGNRQADEAEIERFDVHRTVGRQMLLEPAHMIILGDAGTDDEEVPFPELGQRKVADQLAVVLQHRRQHHAADGGNAGGEQPVEPGFRAWAADLVFGEAGGFHQADAVAHGFRFRADRLEIRRAPPGEFIRRAIRREPQRAFQPVGGAEHRAGLLKPVVDRRGQQRAGAGQFLVRIADREAARIVFAHLGIGIGERRIIAVAADIHGEDVETGIAMDHPVGER